MTRTFSEMVRAFLEALFPRIDDSLDTLGSFELRK